ncbi:ubiquinone anaerobic biosynthesis accessory factor UbiT [Thermithiobacillus plumbiphilus]|uniref:Ubiquinone biosynthesis accessory factor UbiT n=1 Tax=Thermithiobacillus plumbiphilus TaxID=1729899 RepID=A0ABU9DB52_9PROT
MRATRLQQVEWQTLPIFPSSVGRILARLPVYPPSLTLVLALNRLLLPLLEKEVLRAWRGKRFCVQVKDAGLSFFFGLDATGFVACRATLAVDLCISANAYDFLLLAAREEDPDTLFFSRRLLMEGDTELGLLVKNTLDALEPPAWVGRLLQSILTRMDQAI